MKRLVFVGAQGTGKTTMLNHFKDKGFELITEVVRNLAKQGVAINKDGYIDTQARVFSEYYKLLSDQKSYISDRGLVDVIAYTLEAQTRALVEQRHDRLTMFNLTAMQMAGLLEFNALNPDVVYLYFPIEFDVVDDGVRSTDEEYRRTIDSNIKAVLDWANIDYLEVRGTDEERLKLINNLVETMSDIEPPKPSKQTKKPVKSKKNAK